MVGNAFVAREPVLEPSRVAECMGQFIALEGETEIEISGDPLVDSLLSLLYWSNVVQRAHKVVVANQSRIVSVQEEHARSRVTFAVPYYMPRATSLCLEAMGRIFHLLSKSGIPEPVLYSRVGKLLDTLGAKLSCFSVSSICRPHIIRVAQENGWPVTEYRDGICVVGMGANRIRLLSTLTENSNSVAVSIARNKMSTAVWVNKAGMPGAVHTLVSSEQEAIEAAEKIGYPVVVKPADCDGGVAVSSNITDKDALATAYRNALKASPRVLVERFVPGWSYRFTVIDGSVVQVTRKIPKGVKGDGMSSVRSLIDATNKKSKARKMGQRREHPEIFLDEEATGLLQQHGLTLESVLPKGSFLPLRRKSNTAQGGTTELLDLADVHPDNLALCTQACEELGLDIGGVDLITEDASQSWRAVGGVICEVNAQPQVGYSAMQTLLCSRVRNQGRIPLAFLIYDGSVADRLAEIVQSTAGNYRYSDISMAMQVKIAGETWAGQFDSDFDAASFAIFDKRATSLLCALDQQEVAIAGFPVGMFDQVFVTSGVADQIIAMAEKYCHSVARV